MFTARRIAMACDQRSHLLLNKFLAGIAKLWLHLWMYAHDEPNSNFNRRTKKKFHKWDGSNITLHIVLNKTDTALKPLFCPLSVCVCYVINFFWPSKKANHFNMFLAHALFVKFDETTYFCSHWKCVPKPIEKRWWTNTHSYLLPLLYIPYCKYFDWKRFVLRSRCSSKMLHR